jgi:hypothetical protein
MIQPLRTVHRHVFVALAFVLPAVLVAGLGARHAPLPSHIPSIALPSSAYLVRKSGTLWQEHSIGTEFYRNSYRPGEILPRATLTEAFRAVTISFGHLADGCAPK